MAVNLMPYGRDLSIFDHPFIDQFCLICVGRIMPDSLKSNIDFNIHH